MPLLNYTTTVAASKTVAQIHGLLVEAGARQIGTEYGDAGNIVGVAFVVETLHGPRGFQVPVDAHRVQLVLERERVQSRFRTPEAAERVAWRIVKDWLEAQLAIIKTEMVTLDQVMLPYMTTGDGRTMFELYQAQQLALPSGATV